MISVVVSTIGCRFALESLDSMRRWDEVLVVVDMVGRSCSPLESEYPLAVFRADAGARGARVVLYEPGAAPWAVMNGAYNAGAREARGDWLLFAHDDVDWGGVDYRTRAEAALRELPVLGRAHSRRMVGVGWPSYETRHDVRVPSFPEGTTAICQCLNPTSLMLERAAFDDLGGFDEVGGVWYDGELEREAQLRDWWWLHLPLPPTRHASNSTYLVNRWGAGWAANPVWGRYEENYVRRFGLRPTDQNPRDYPQLILDADYEPDILK